MIALSLKEEFFSLLANLLILKHKHTAKLRKYTILFKIIDYSPNILNLVVSGIMVKNDVKI